MTILKEKRSMRIQVKDFMSAPVITAIGENSVEDIRELMKDKGIHAIPIVFHTTDTVDRKMIIKGIVTSSDINKELHNDAVMNDVMTSSTVHVVHTTSSAKAAAKMMIKHQVHHLVVMDDGEIRGMISAMDFVKLVAENSKE
ncbi:CBS domain-containing protein [Cryomorphaceae bacterium 1068]|nr:CBS domain-containing protein [Cryomorphaceae bacterium 1068]